MGIAVGKATIGGHHVHLLPIEHFEDHWIIIEAVFVGIALDLLAPLD
jgi:hypothetical protein